MNFIVLYGPTAAGKKTVAEELAKITGYKLLDNHKILNAIAALFPFEDPKLNPIRMRLGWKFRLELFEEAAKANVDFITTIVGGVDAMDVLRQWRVLTERNGGNFLLVQLLPSHETIMNRVESASRHGIKVSTKARLAEYLTGRPGQFDTFQDRDHLIIDNSQLAPRRVAEQIASHYNLPIVETD